MGTIPYNLDIPDGPNNPSSDQPKMKENTNSLNQIIAIDHYSFGSSGAKDGWHKQSTYPILTVKPTTGAGIGAVYTKDVGGGDIQLFYEKQDGTEIQLTTGKAVTNTPLAFVNFDGTILGDNAAQTLRGTPFNVTSVTRIGTAKGKYQVNFTNALPNSNYTVLLTAQRDGIGSGACYGAILDVAYATAVTTTTLQIQFTSDGSSLKDVNMGNLVIFGL